MRKFFSGLGLAALALLVPHAVTAAEALQNGDFETGDLTGWTATSNSSTANGGCDTDWTVIGAYTTQGSPFCIDPASVTDPSPVGGSWQAANSFDGDGPQEFRLSQTVAVPAGVTSATLSWQDQWAFAFPFIPTNPPAPAQFRRFQVLITDAADATTLETVYDRIFNGSEAGAWAARSFPVDLTPYAGQSVNVVFRNFIPENFTGPAYFALDDASLDIQADAATGAGPAQPVPFMPPWLLMALAALVAGFGGRQLLRS